MSEELKIKITAEIADLKKNLKEVQEQLDKTSNESKKLNKVGDTMKKVAGTVAKVSAVAFTAAAAGIAAITKQAVQNYAEYEQLVGGVETLFKDSAGTVMEYASNAYKTAGMSANEYMTNVTSFSASLLQSLGGDTAAAAAYADSAIIDMADNANKMGSNIADIQNAYQGFAKQNYTMLDNLKLGYGGTKEEMQRLIDDANRVKEANGEMADLSIDSFADVTEAINVIQTEMGITGTTAEEASSTIQGSASAMKAAWSNLLTGLADENADFDALLTDFIDSVGTFAENLIPRIGTALKGAVKLFDGLIQELVAAVPELVNELLPAILDAIVNITNSITAALPELITTIVDAFILIVDYLPAITEAITAALPTLIPALITGITDMIVSLCGSFSDIIQPIIDYLPDIIIAIVDGLVSNLPQLIDGIITLVMGIVKAIPQIIKGIISALPTIITMILDSLMECIPQIIAGLVQVIAEIAASLPQIFGDLITGVVNIFKTIWEWIKKVFEPVGEWFAKIFTKAKESIQNAFKSVGDFFSNIWSSIKNAFGNVKGWFSDKFNAAKDAVLSVFDKIKSGIKSKIEAARDTVRNVIDKIKSFFKFEWSLPKLKLPKVSISGKFSLSPLSVPKFKLSWNALGGVFDKPAIFGYGDTLQGIGENGAEAVVPLENNLAWLDKLAGMLNDRMGGGKNIVLQVDGKTFAQISCDSINQLTRQRGSIPLNLI
jgi:phage-related protein